MPAKQQPVNNSGNNRDWELWVLLHQASDALARVRDLELSRLGVSLMQMAVLSVMKQIGAPATTSQISRWLLREHHTVAALLDRMEKHGLVKYEQDSNRLRRRLFDVTEKGQIAWEESRKSDVLNEVLSILSTKEKNALRGQLKELRDKGIRAFAGFKLYKQLPFP